MLRIATTATTNHIRGLLRFCGGGGIANASSFRRAGRLARSEPRSPPGKGTYGLGSAAELTSVKDNDDNGRSGPWVVTELSNANPILES